MPRHVGVGWSELNIGGFSRQDDDIEGEKDTGVVACDGEGRALLGPLRKDLLRCTEIDYWRHPRSPHYAQTGGDVTKPINCCQSDEQMKLQT